MGISVADNFDHKSKKPLDARTSYTTLALMKAVTDANMNEGCFAYCVETDKYYTFKSTNTVDADTGKWREFETGGGGGAGSDTTAYHTDDSAETSIVDADSFPFYDASASTPKRSLWSNVKSVLKTYFDSLYQKTLTAGTNITISNDTISASMPVMGTFSKGDLYDTTEKVIGKWTDGRPLYQRTYAGTIPSSDGTQALFSLPSSYCRVMYAEGCAFWDGTNYISIPFSTESSSKADHAGLYTYNNTMYIDMTDTNSYFRGKSYYVTIRYIKTSDSTNSYNYSSANDYSTSEKIIGTWLSGETLYQRTFTGTIASSDDTTVGTIGSSSRVKSFNGAIQQATTIDVPISVCLGGSSTDYSYPYNDGGTIKMNCGSEMRGRPYWLTVQYIK